MILISPKWIYSPPYKSICKIKEHIELNQKPKLAGRSKWAGWHICHMQYLYEIVMSHLADLKILGLDVTFFKSVIILFINFKTKVLINHRRIHKEWRMLHVAVSDM